MTPAEQSAYANYPAWMAQLAGVTDALTHLPLDELLAANVRMALTGTRVGQDQPGIVDPVHMERQRRLLEKAIAFRDSVRSASPDSPGDPRP